MRRTLSYQVGILTLGRMAAYMVMFFVPLVNVRTLSQHDYGIYRQFWLLFETLTAIMVMSFPNSLFYYLPRAESRREKSVYVTQTMVFLLVMGVLSWGAYGVMRAMLGEGLGGVVKRYFWNFCLFTLFMIVSRLMDTLFVAEKQAERQSLYHVVANSLQAVMVILLSWFTRSITLMIWGLTIYAFGRFLFALVYTGVFYRLTLRTISIKSIKEQLSYAVPLGLASIILFLMAQTDKYIITHYMGAASFAIYSVGAFQLPFVNIIRGSVTNITFPLMAEYQKQGRSDAIVELYQRATLKTAVLFFPIFVFLEVSARPFIQILFTHQYREAVPIFSIYLLLFLRSTVDTGSLLMVFKKNDVLVKVFAGGFFVNLFLSIYFYKKFGWLGVPVATVISGYGISLANIMAACKLLDISILRILPWRRMGLVLAVAVLPALIPWYFYHSYFVDSFRSLGGIGALYFIAYFALSAKLELISWGDIKSIFGQPV